VTYQFSSAQCAELKAHIDAGSKRIVIPAKAGIHA
jgi:hypothetical protein